MAVTKMPNLLTRRTYVSLILEKGALRMLAKNIVGKVWETSKRHLAHCAVKDTFL